jgi:protein-tyrosine kinase
MSRIHDLLNRVEHERETLRVVEVDRDPVAKAVAISAVPEREPPPQEQDSTSSSLEASATLDDRIERCPSTEWNPDPASLLFAGASEKSGSEEFRALRSRLYRLRETAKLKTLLVSSALSKEGKSFVAVNLAQAIALQQECRVLLIDANLRKPQLHVALGTRSTPGLADYLWDEVDLFSTLQKGWADRLFLIPAGRQVPGPTELVANGRVKSLLLRLEPAFDWIIVDSPPAIPFSDASLIANYCDRILLVVRASSTPLEVVRQARRKFREGHLAGVVLNGADIQVHV